MVTVSSSSQLSILAVLHLLFDLGGVTGALVGVFPLDLPLALGDVLGGVMNPLGWERKTGEPAADAANSKSSSQFSSINESLAMYPTVHVSNQKPGVQRGEEGGPRGIPSVWSKKIANIVLRQS